jgi:hypothetical protein
MSDNSPTIPACGSYLYTKLNIEGALTRSGTPLASSTPTTYEELIKSLDTESNVLQYLPPENEVNQLFGESYAPSNRHSTACKLAFGTYQGGATAAQLYVFLSPPSHKHKDPHLRFIKCSAEGKNACVKCDDIRYTDSALKIHEFWRPFGLENGEIARKVLTAVLKAIFIRKGIAFPTPIPIPHQDFRSNLVAGCEMFKNHRHKHANEATKSPLKEVNMSMNAADTAGTDSSSLVVPDTSSITLLITMELIM